MLLAPTSWGSPLTPGLREASLTVPATCLFSLPGPRHHRAHLTLTGHLLSPAAPWKADGQGQGACRSWLQPGSVWSGHRMTLGLKVTPKGGRFSGRMAWCSAGSRTGPGVFQSACRRARGHQATQPLSGAAGERHTTKGAAGHSWGGPGAAPHQTGDVWKSPGDGRGSGWCWDLSGRRGSEGVSSAGKPH